MFTITFLLSPTEFVLLIDLRWASHEFSAVYENGELPEKRLRVFENVMKNCQGRGENDKNDSSNFSFQKQLSQKETHFIYHFSNYFITDKESHTAPFMKTLILPKLVDSRWKC